MDRIFYVLLLFSLISCNTYEESKPLLGLLKTIGEVGVNQRDIKLVTIPTDSGFYYLTDESKVINDLVNRFSVQQNQDCLKIEEELKKWAENPIEPFEHREKLQIGDILFQIKNKDRLSVIGFSYCKDSKTNLNEFKKRMSIAIKLDTVLQENEAIRFMKFVSGRNELILRNKFDGSNGKPIEISYYKIIRKTPYNNG